LPAATFALVPTAVSFTGMLTPLGNRFIARPAVGKTTEEIDVPLDAAVVTGLSADALHVWRADPMPNQVHEYLGHAPLERITAVHDLGQVPGHDIPARSVPGTRHRGDHRGRVADVHGVPRAARPQREHAEQDQPEPFTLLAPGRGRAGRGPHPGKPS
jgi:hypothetical protein